VNPISPLHTRGDELLIQATFYPFEMFSKRRHGISLRPVITGAGYEGKTNGWVNTIDASVILDAGQLHVFTVNRSLDKPTKAQVELADRNIAALTNGELLTGPGPKAANSFEQPALIKPQGFDAVRVVNGRAEVELPPLSIAAMTFRLS
jgi:alpha-N-arabinofuranosidase